MFLSTLFPATTTMTTASTSMKLATLANRLGVQETGRLEHADTPATIPSPGVSHGPDFFPGERPFDGLQEDQAMLRQTTLTGRSAVGTQRADGRKSPGFTSYCWLTQPATAS